MAKRFAPLVTFFTVSWFDGWYRTTHPRVVAAVSVACGDVDLARDAADEAFVRALSKAEAISRMEAPEAWVYKVALNVMRRRQRRRAIEERLFRWPRVEPSTSGPEPHPELWEAVKALPERQKLAVVLRYIADLTEPEIAAVMGISRGTVAATLAAGRSRLADQLSGLRFPDSDEEYRHA